MRRQLVITLSTVHGTRQITLGQLARYGIVLLLAVAAGTFALSNYLLVRATDSLEVLESEHLALSSDYDQLNLTLDKVIEHRGQLERERTLLEARYKAALGSQQLYLGELDDLSKRLQTLSQDRESLADEMRRIATERGYLEEEMQQLAAARIQDNTRLTQQRIAMDSLAHERQALEAQNETLAKSLSELGQSLGLGQQLEGLDSEASAALIASRLQERKLMLNIIPNGLPAQFERVNSDFGYRLHPVSKERALHKGVDLKMKRGTPVYATADGIVESAGNDTKGGFGKIVRLQHSFGFRTYYAHLDKILVKGGEYVVKGQQIAESGSTGRSTGPHLHYEVRKLWTPLDPAPFMSWSLENYEQLFEQVGEVNWDSLEKQYQLRIAAAR